MIKNFLKKDRFPLLLLAVCLLAYGIFSPFLGFYWDDLPYMWFKHTNGPLGAIRAIALDRPVLGLFYALPLSLFGEAPIIWQIFAIFCRWIFILSVFWFLNRLFPKNIRENKLIILLFSVFPGFSQQFIAVIYSHAFLIFALYFYSLTLFLKAVEKNKFQWLGLLSIFLALLCMGATEYVVGLEILRPLIIYKFISEEKKEQKVYHRLKDTLSIWLPYLLAGLGFIVYRIFFASSVLYKVQHLGSLSQSPLKTIGQLIVVSLSNIYQALIAAWIQILKPLSDLPSGSLFSLIYIVVSISSFSIAFAYLYYRQKYNPVIENKSHRGDYYFPLLVGCILVLIFAGVPFWAANLKLGTHFPADRFFLPFMLASSAIVFLLISSFARSKLFFLVSFCLVFGLSFSYQLYQANEYRNEWDRFRDFIEQISWRIPSLEEGTLLVTDSLTLKYYSDNSLTAAINWVYANTDQKDTLPYLINFTKARLGKSLPSLDPEISVVHNYRTHIFTGSTDQMLLFYHLPPGCVHFADPDLDPLNPLIDSSIRSSTKLSKLDLIFLEKKQNPVFFLMNDKSESWCYYYQKASLAAQFQDWQTILDLGDIAFSLDDHPNDASERIPFIEAYAMTGNWEKAIEQTLATYHVSDLYQPMLCRLWERIESRSSDAGETDLIFQKINSILECN